MKICISIVLLGLGAQFAATPQGVTLEKQPAFEVASVKPGGSGDDIQLTRGGLIVRGGRIATCLKWAYHVQEGQVVGATRAIQDSLVLDRYEIDAKAPGVATEAQTRLMLQALLAERFQVAFHKERREVQAFGLVVDKGSLKFRESSGGETRMEAKNKFNRSWLNTNMGQFADAIADAMQAPVLDQTGLAGSYDLSIDLTSMLTQSQERGERPEVAGMMVTALREQLGLRLVSMRTSVDVLIVDRVEKPSAN